jgi:hypothetical protein
LVQVGPHQLVKFKGRLVVTVFLMILPVQAGAVEQPGQVVHWAKLVVVAVVAAVQWMVPRVPMLLLGVQVIHRQQLLVKVTVVLLVANRMIHRAVEVVLALLLVLVMVV